MSEIEKSAEIAPQSPVDTERLQLAQQLAPILGIMDDLLNGDTPMDELKANALAILGAVDSGAETEQELATALKAKADAESEQPEAQEESPVIKKWQSQFEALPEAAKKGLTWEQVIQASGSEEELLAKTSKLEEAQIFEVDEKGNLVFCDGTDEVPQSTIGEEGKDYFTCRREAHEDGLELFTEEEYKRLQCQCERKYEKRLITWLESGENPSLALFAYWRDGIVLVGERDPDVQVRNRGARRLLRVSLNIGS